MLSYERTRGLPQRKADLVRQRHRLKLTARLTIWLPFLLLIAYFGLLLETFGGGIAARWSGRAIALIFMTSIPAAFAFGVHSLTNAGRDALNSRESATAIFGTLLTGLGTLVVVFVLAEILGF